MKLVFELQKAEEKVHKVTNMTRDTLLCAVFMGRMVHIVQQKMEYLKGVGCRVSGVVVILWSFVQSSVQSLEL